LETQYAATLTNLVKELDSGAEPYQPGIRESLFETNSPTFANLIGKGGLAARLATMKDDGALTQDAFLSVLSRAPTHDERGRMKEYLQRPSERRSACEEIVWALMTSAEFRFNH